MCEQGVVFNAHHPIRQHTGPSASLAAWSTFNICTHEHTNIHENTHIHTLHTPIIETPDALTPVHSHYHMQLPHAGCDLSDWFSRLCFSLGTNVCVLVSAHTLTLRHVHTRSHTVHIPSNTHANTQTNKHRYTSAHKGMYTLSCITQTHTQQRANERWEVWNWADVHWGLNIVALCHFNPPEQIVRQKTTLESSRNTFITRCVSASFFGILLVSPSHCSPLLHSLCSNLSDFWPSSPLLSCPPSPLLAFAIRSVTSQCGAAHWQHHLSSPASPEVHTHTH